MSNCVHFRPTINKSVSTKHKLIKHTLALGFSVDFSEDKEPSDELGDKPRPPEAETAPAHSELEDAELPGRPWEFTVCVCTCALPVTGPSNSLEFVFSWPFDEAGGGA